MTPPGQNRGRRRGSGLDHTIVADQQERLAVRLSTLNVVAFANRGTWMNNGAALHPSKVSG
ncbi:MAG: hypothetical protein GY832_30150 [Chloroflexi bacterium]|nr:hypothetical protein [Chloroflexota bacterium]